MVQIEEFETEGLGSVWVRCPDLSLILRLEEALEAKVRVYDGQKPPTEETPSAVVFCPNAKDVASEVRRLRALVPDAPVLVFGLCVDPRLAQVALQAGARGVIHAGMRSAQIVRALSLARRGEIVIPKDLLGELVGQRLFLQLPKLLDP